MSSQPQSLEQVVRVAQIITLGLVMGVITFGVIVAVISSARQAPPAGVLVSRLAAAVAGVAFVLHLIVPPLVVKQQRMQSTAEQLPGLYLTKTIIGLAILEGAAFFNLAAVIVEHNVWSFAVAGGLVFWMLALFPTQTRIAHWVEAQRMSRQRTA